MMTTMQKLLLPDSFWHELTRQQQQESECHCKCGEIFYSMSYYIGKKTKDIIQKGCPACGSFDMKSIIPKSSKFWMPPLGDAADCERNKLRSKNVVSKKDTSKLE